MCLRRALRCSLALFSLWGFVVFSRTRGVSSGPPSAPVSSSLLASRIEVSSRLPQVMVGVVSAVVEEGSCLPSPPRRGR